MPDNCFMGKVELEDELTIWRYVACRVRDETGTERWEVRELYPGPEGEGFAYTEAPIEAQGDTLQELRRDLQNMLNDSHRPYLDLTSSLQRLVRYQG